MTRSPALRRGLRAERFGLLGELRRELDAGHHVAHHTSMRAWLDVAS